MLPQKRDETGKKNGDFLLYTALDVAVEYRVSSKVLTVVNSDLLV